MTNYNPKGQYGTADNFSVFDPGFNNQLLQLMILDDEFMREYREILTVELFPDDVRQRIAECARRFYDDRGTVAKTLFLDSLKDFCFQEKCGDAFIKLTCEKAQKILSQPPGDKDYIIEKLRDFFDFGRLRNLRYDLDAAIDGGDLDAARDACSRFIDTDADIPANPATRDSETTNPANPASRYSDNRPEMAEEGFYGIAGDFAKEIDTYTEADPVATLINLLVGFGNLIGSGPHAVVAATEHPSRLFAVQVGASGESRKGHAWTPIAKLLAMVDNDYAKNRIRTAGLSSGEGMIYAVRNEKGADPGEPDKRLLLIETEFSAMLKKMTREGNSLCGYLRSAWDSGDLCSMTLKAIQATGAHISIIGHTTPEELLRYLTENEKVNGFANRFLWFFVNRTKLRPDGEAVPVDLLKNYAWRVQQAVVFTRNRGVVSRNAEASEIWNAIYGDLDRQPPTLAGSILGRAAPQVLRLSLTYALLDSSPEIRLEHLMAALAVWDYCEETVRHIFRDRTGSRDADKILDALRTKPEEGLSEGTLSRLFGDHSNRTEAKKVALRLLLDLSLVTRYRSGERSRIMYKINPGKPSLVASARNHSPKAGSGNSGIKDSPKAGSGNSGIKDSPKAGSGNSGIKDSPKAGSGNSGIKDSNQNNRPPTIVELIQKEVDRRARVMQENDELCRHATRAAKATSSMEEESKCLG